MTSNLKGSIFRSLTRKEAEDLINAVKHDKYWKVSPEDRDFIFVVVLSRARIKSRRGMYAKATHFRRIEVVKEAARFCRRWRILLVDKRRMLAVSVLTWRAFNKIVSKRVGPIVRFILLHSTLPPYINEKALSKILENYDLEQI
ncbi:MAG: hypothetical protein FGF52_03765 [Candidatus Brockarchaeota archaeon]|nr:hypothetical protein [Candidatus Brockarchaeota archaeon]